jgi:hypothetical protein
MPIVLGKGHAGDVASWTVISQEKERKQVARGQRPKVACRYHFHGIFRRCIESLLRRVPAMSAQLRIFISCLIAFIHAMWPLVAQAENATSTATPTEGKACKLVSRDRETGDSTTRCPGIAGYSLLVLESDDRASITLIGPDKQVLPLNFWDAIPSFSTLAHQIEWRQVTRQGKQAPIGMIVRVDTVDQSDVAHPKPVSFILVARIKENSACLIAKIPTEQADAILAARQAVDDQDRECLQPM